jgi:hypothetical protein
MLRALAGHEFPGVATTAVRPFRYFGRTTTVAPR